MLEPARRRAHEAVRRHPGDLDAWVELARAVRQAGDAPVELAPADLEHLLVALAAEPSARDLADLAMAALGVEAAGPRYAARRWLAPGAAGEDDRGPYDAATGMPLAVRHVALDLDLVWVPPGRYPVGWFDGAQDPRLTQVARTVELARGYYLGVAPVTQGQYHGLTGLAPSFRRGATRPVENVGHTQADAAAAAAEARRGGAAAGWGFRIPDGDRWEVALRGHDVPRRGNTSEGWFRENAGAITHPVGELAPGPHGTVDQMGNVSEWCTDRDTTLGPGRPDGAPRPLESRMVRGGSWCDAFSAWGTSQLAYELVSHPYDRPRASIGMRLLLGPSRSTVEP